MLMPVYGSWGGLPLVCSGCIVSAHRVYERGERQVIWGKRKPGRQKQDYWNVLVGVAHIIWLVFNVASSTVLSPTILLLLTISIIDFWEQITFPCHLIAIFVLG